MSPVDGVILVADDDHLVTELYAELLGDRYEVHTANSGTAAMAAIDDSIDVAVLDRRMPDRSGDEVLARFRERGVDCPVIMVTAVSPDVDIIDLSCTEYLVKPISGTELRTAIAQALTLAERSDRVREYYALLDKQFALEAQQGLNTATTSREYRALQQRLADLLDTVGSSLSVLDGELAIRLRRKWSGATTQLIVDAGADV